MICFSSAVYSSFCALNDFWSTKCAENSLLYVFKKDEVTLGTKAEKK
jgi:hypothetical protein